MEWRPAQWSVSASVNLSLHHKVQTPEVLFWHWLTRVVLEKGRKMVVVVVDTIQAVTGGPWEC